MSDLKLLWNSRFFDLQMDKNDLVIDDGLQTSVILSLFTDRRISTEELPAGETDKGGWWGDALSEIEGDKTGSRLWLLRREKQSEEVRRRAVEYAQESLEWMITDGVAQSVSIEAEWMGTGFLGLGITIQRPQGKITFSYKLNWNAEIARNDGP